MTRTVTIEVPDEFLPQLDRALARWTTKGKPPEVTLLNMLRHGMDMMDIGDMDAPEGPPGEGMDDDIPF